MGGLAVSEGRHAKVGLFARTLAVEYFHEAVFLFRKPVAACFEALFLGLCCCGFGADVQDELGEIFEDGFLLHLKRLNLREQFVCIAEDFPGLFVKLDGIRQPEDFRVDLIPTSVRRHFRRP